MKGFKMKGEKMRDYMMEFLYMRGLENKMREGCGIYGTYGINGIYGW